ncbi:MAG: ASKHA domain-containing protein [Nitrospirota bacterium]|nr:ASKHA domain-containing protein [Nitrospirota bacterium]
MNIVFPLFLILDKPTLLDKRADRDRLLDRLNQQTGIYLPVEIDLEVLREIPSLLRKDGFSILLTLGFMRDRLKVIATNRRFIYGVAIDIGTTNIVASLFDLNRNQRIGHMEGANPQIVEGLDVLSRVHMAFGGKSKELHRLLVKGVNGLINNLCNTNKINRSDIYAAVIAGNTIMTHFLLDLPVENIPIEPYIPVMNRIDFIEPVDIGLEINQRGIVYVFPNAGSYVGGDIIAGILSSGMYKEREPTILIDVGTNAEIVLGCDEWIILGAGAAGPALESGISEIGMMALEGAIYKVEIDSLSYEVKIKTIRDKKPEGICGSGLIELISELYATGIIDQQGKFVINHESEIKNQRIRDFNGQKGFVIYESKEKKLIVKETDIDNFLRSKAAMFTSLYVIVKSVGLSFGEISRVYVSGAFGMGIDTEKAIRIGMIPDIDRRKFIAIGNSSLKGAEMLLMNKNLLSDIDRICEMITYREMNTDGEFMKEFPAAMFIPHTNPEVLKT